MSDTALRDLVLRRLEASTKPEDAWSMLVLAALDGPEALAGYLDSQTEPPRPEKAATQPKPGREPLGAYLKAITVEGFRGIGQKKTLELPPGPGLTLVVGRNGSGKSSFAEALELLVTGDTYRWAHRAKVWREGWRNLHHKTSAIEAEFLVEGEKGPTIVATRWKDEADLDGAETFAQIHGKPRMALAELGWKQALTTYRPFLSYNELGSMLDEGPSKLFDALSAILGLEELTQAQETLADARKDREKAHKDAGQKRDEILGLLRQMDDDRARTLVAALDKKDWGLDESRQGPGEDPHGWRLWVREEGGGSMQVGESTLKGLIEGQKQFQVPLYQRQYTWAVPQLSQLWQDILDQYDLLTPDEAGRVEDAPTHFLGSMVLAPSPMMHAQGVTPFLIIDGQQRLTSLLIVVCALRDHASASQPHEAERFNELYLINKYSKGLAYYRLLPTQSDREAFFACVTHDPQGRTGVIAQAYAFFRAQLAQRGPDNQSLDASRLETVLWQRLQFVAITADRNDNVHRIFESLNDRGVRLTQADLLRNYVFMLLPSRAEEVYERVWRPMQDSLTPAQLETLVFVDLVLRGKATIKRQDIYRAQQDRLRPLEGNEEAVESEVRELARRARLFRRIVQPLTEPHGAIRTAFERLERWGASTTYPVLMHLLDLLERGACSVDEVVESVAYIESFLVRRMIADVPTNNLNRIFSAFVPQLRKDLAIGEAVRHALSGERKYWPSDARLQEAIRNKPFYFQGRQEQKLLVFQRLEDSYEHAEPIDWCKANLSIEHVLPQSLTDEWRDALSAAGDDPVAVHAELLHTLGNLTTTAYNGELSNNPFERKQEILSGSHLELNRAITPAGRWGRTEILARADELATRATKIWPAPLPGVEDAPAGRDWSAPHAALAALPYGAWTTYSDLAELIGSHQVPVGQHIAMTANLLNGHRVLTADGLVADGFRWSDPGDTRDVHAVLQAEGVRFGSDRRADASQRLHADDLADLVGEVVEPIAPEEDREHGWRLRRSLRYLRHFYGAPEGRLHRDAARDLAIQEGYDPRGVAGFYQGTPSLRKDGQFRVLTEEGRRFFEENRHQLD